MPRSRNVSRFPSRSARRATAWSQGPADVGGGASASGSSLWSASVTPAVEGLTLIRTRGIFSVTQATAGVALDGFFGAIGIQMITAEAAAIGITAIPTPLDDENWDGWLFHQYFDVRSATATFADGVNSGGVFARIEIDSKAMRKFPGGSVLVGVTEVVESGTATIETHGSTRMLFKLP